MPRYLIDDLDDPRLEPFREIRLRNPTRYAGYFIAEGRLVVQRLLASEHRTLAVLVENGREESIGAPVPDDVDLLLVHPKVIPQVVGFDFHRGVMACGARPAMASVRDLQTQTNSREIFVVAHEVQDPTNLGSMIRSAAAMGVSRMVLGRATADPLARRVLRVSMGNALGMQFYVSQDLAADLDWLWQQRQLPSVAATLRDDSVPLQQLPTLVPGSKLLVFGNEGSGLPSDVEQACTYRATIPMQCGTDSLNVAVATGIFLYVLAGTA